MVNNMFIKLVKVDEQLFLSVFNDVLLNWFRKLVFGLLKSGDGGFYVVLFFGFWWFIE